MMQTLTSLFNGFSVALMPLNLVYCLIGVVLGIIVGALPGLGPTAGIAIILPMTFGVNATSGIILLAGIYYGAMYGGAITSILLNVPGDAASIMTTLDGYQLSKKGRAGQALGMSTIASFVGGTIGIIAFTFLAPIISKLAVTFGPPEYFVLTFMGVSTVSGLTGSNPVKGYISALVGFFIAVIGLDIVQGTQRFVFGGSIYLYGGIDFIPVAMGLFGLAELLDANSEGFELNVKKEDLHWKKQLPSKEDWHYAFKPMIQGSIIGFFVGCLPGAGATLSTFLAYGAAKKTSKRGEQFGTGVIEGVASPEAANNAASTGTMIPMITLGVPGGGATAMMLGGMLMFGLTPGPLLMQTNPDFVWGFISSLYIGNLLLVILTLMCVPFFVKILKVPMYVLNPLIMTFVIIGAYSLNNSMFDVGLTIFFGILGFFMKKLDYPVAPMVLAVILGTMLENGLRQSLILSRGSMMIFFTRPVSCVILIISLIAIFWPLIKLVYTRFNKKQDLKI